MTGREKQQPEYFGDDPIATANRLECLAADLRLLAAGQPPSPARLSKAPVLRNWGVLSKPTKALIGRVQGPPGIDDERLVLSSELFALDAEGRWARTMTRYYRLLPRNQEESNG